MTGVRLSNVTPRCSQRCGIASSRWADAAVPVASLCGRFCACGVAPKSALGTAICGRFRRDFCHLRRSVTEEGNIGSPSGAHHLVANVVTLPGSTGAPRNSKRLGNGEGVPKSGTRVLEDGTQASNRDGADDEWGSKLHVVLMRGERLRGDAA